MPKSKSGNIIIRATCTKEEQEAFAAQCKRLGINQSTVIKRAVNQFLLRPDTEQVFKNEPTVLRRKDGYGTSSASEEGK